MDSRLKSTSRSGQRKCPTDGCSTLIMLPTAASLNHGKSSKERNSSRPSASSQSPWLDTCVTSIPEVGTPCVDELNFMRLDDCPDSSQLCSRKPVTPRQCNTRFQPVFRLPVCAVHMYVHACLFAREKEKTKTTLSKYSWAHSRQRQVAGALNGTNETQLSLDKYGSLACRSGFSRESGLKALLHCYARIVGAASAANRA